MTELYVVEPLKNGYCKECTQCTQVKRTLKCDDIREGKLIPCREVRDCSRFNKKCTEII